MQIEEYRKRLEEFEESLNRELYCYYSGVKARLETRGLYADYSDLYTIDTIRQIESEIERTPKSFESRRKSLARLRWFAIEHNLDSNASVLAQEISAFEAQRRFAWNGKEIALIQIPLFLGQEADALKRRRLNDLQIAAWRGIEPLRMERLVCLQAAAVGLGFENCLDTWQTCTGISYKDLAAQLEGVVSRSEAAYLDCLNGSLLATLSLSIHEVRHFDIEYWKRTNEAWEFFSQDRLMPVVEETFSRLGLKPQTGGKITMDFERRPSKQPRPFCVPIRIPDEIKIVLLPHGECDDYAALLHESGHAHHFAWTSPSLAAEYRICGDRGLSETYAFLFEYLLMDREWLQEAFGSAAPSGLLRFQSLYRAYLVRRYLGKLQYEIALYGGAVLTDAPKIYAESLRRCTGLEHDPESYLEDLTEGFYSAAYLRAWIFEVMLRDHLRSKYGKSWYRNRSAGGFLKDIWETGQLYSADELCREIGLGALDAQALGDEIEEGLRQ